MKVGDQTVTMLQSPDPTERYKGPAKAAHEKLQEELRRLIDLMRVEIETGGLPQHAKLLMQIYDKDALCDHRVAKEIFDRINLPASEKDFVMLQSDSRLGYKLEAEHGTPNGGAGDGDVNALDYYGVSYHGQASTHLDSLCHVWNENGMWNGRKPTEEIGFDGAKFGAITNWSSGIITRGVLLDVPRFRGQAYVTQEAPIHGWELEDVAQSQGIKLEHSFRCVLCNA